MYDFDRRKAMRWRGCGDCGSEAPTETPRHERLALWSRQYCSEQSFASKDE
jgi:hypothetical protein